TDEVLIELNEMKLSKEKIAAFANCLRMGNAVKFAKFIPPDFENQKCFSETKEMITHIHKIETKEPKDGI
ncbi:MAG: hypothetical protein ABI366_05480, partial [Ginsengibacter sp.]